MFVSEVEAFADYYDHGADCCPDPDESEYIRQKADEARAFAETLRKAPAFNKVLAMAAYSIAEYAVDVGDRELFDELVALADGFAVKAAKAAEARSHCSPTAGNASAMSPQVTRC